MRKYIDPINKILNPFDRSIEPEPGDKGWGVLGEMKGVDADRRAINAALSTDRRDRYGEIVLPSAFGDFVSEFNNRNAFLDSHNHERQAGHWEGMRVTKHAFEGTAVCSDNPDLPVAKEVWALHCGGHRKTFSIGFLGHRYKMQRMEIDGSDQFVRVWTVAEPLEGSSVAVPANPDAAARALSAFNAASADPDQVTSMLSQGDIEALLNALRPEIKKEIHKALLPDCGGPLASLIADVAETVAVKLAHADPGRDALDGLEAGGEADWTPVLNGVGRLDSKL